MKEGAISPYIVDVYKRQPVPLPLRAVREAEFPAAHGKRPVMAVDSVMARPLDKACLLYTS